MDLSSSSLHHHHHHHHHRHRSPSSHKEYDNGNDQERTDYIIDTFLKNFGNEMRENPKGWRGRFRKMAADEFAFYRGSAVLFYRDMAKHSHHDQWLTNCPEASRIFIHVRIQNKKKNKNIVLFLFRVIFMLKISVHTLIDMVLSILM
jgi:hypothetical protein